MSGTMLTGMFLRSPKSNGSFATGEYWWATRSAVHSGNRTSRHYRWPANWQKRNGSNDALPRRPPLPVSMTMCPLTGVRAPWKWGSFCALKLPNTCPSGKSIVTQPSKSMPTLITGAPKVMPRPRLSQLRGRLPRGRPATGRPKSRADAGVVAANAPIIPRASKLALIIFFSFITFSPKIRLCISVFNLRITPKPHS